jgi:hypothetical protein
MGSVIRQNGEEVAIRRYYELLDIICDRSLEDLKHK